MPHCNPLLFASFALVRRPSTLVHALSIAGWLLFVSWLSYGCATTSLAQEKPLAIELSHYVYTQSGQIPVILSAPHGGTREIPGVPERKGEGMKKGASGFFAGRDTGTEELAHAVSTAIEKAFGKKPYMVVSQSHRKFFGS